MEEIIEFENNKIDNNNKNEIETIKFNGQVYYMEKIINNRNIIFYFN